MSQFNAPDKQDRLIRLGTRQSKLALLQTDIVCSALLKKFPELKFDIVHITSTGDRVRDRPIAELNASGVFVKELEEALLEDKVDLVVHSLKDLPTSLPDELILAAVCNRLDPRDVLLSRNNMTFTQLPTGSRVATSSRRRSAQLRHLRPDLEFIDVRGNVTTRVQKLDEGMCDAIVLAAAGLIRLDLQDRIAEYLDYSTSTPSAGQATLAIECRSNDHAILGLVKTIEDNFVRAEITAERSFLAKLGGGCSIPVGAVAEVLHRHKLRLRGCVAAIGGEKIIRSTIEGELKNANELGVALAQAMIKLGAETLLEPLRKEPINISPP